MYIGLQVKYALFLRTALFWVITQRIVDVSEQPIGPTFWVQECLRNHYSLRNNAEERCCHQLRGGSLKSRMPVILVRF
jgi:hypothetical protein